MHVPITLAALVLVTAALVLFRNRWPTLPRPLRFVSVTLSLCCILLSVFMTARGWNTVSTIANASIRWCAVSGYVLLLLLFTRLRPQWLTVLTAVVLLVPVLAASIFLPLTFLFDRDPKEHTIVAPGLLFTKVPWNASGLGNGGMDLTLSRIPNALPFLQNQILTLRIYNTQCDTAATVATLNPSTHIVLIHCPPSAARPTDPPKDIKVRVF